MFLVLKGMAMGMAEAIPGVSGGTIAFITGIYEELLLTIKSVSPANLRLLIRDPAEAWKRMNGKFLIWLIAGMALGLVFGVLVLGRLLITDKELLWAFFFGIVLASAIYFAKIQRWGFPAVLLAILGLVLSYWITHINPGTGSDNLFYIFGAGVVAISALMLPGISGSFILLLLGLYETIILSLKAILSDFYLGENVVVLGTFGLGALVGLFSFARILSYLFKNFHDLTMAFMVGILTGSLNKLWPWKIILTAFNKETGQIESIDGVLLPGDAYKIVAEQNVVPSIYAEFTDPRLTAIVVCFALGLLLIYLMARAAVKNDKTTSG